MDLKVAAAAYIYIHLTLKSKNSKKTKKPRRWWQTQLYTRRDADGGATLLSDLKFQSISGQYKNFTRMSPTEFEFLINLIGEKVSRKDTTFRKAISVEDRLALTLRFFASGDSYTSLQFLFKISKQAISQIVPEVCEALIEGLGNNIQIPKTGEEWLSVAQEYEFLWNFPHCLGALDGKHVVLQAPIKSGSEYFSYKSTFSIVLLALVDANYNFLFINVGCQGRISDSGVFQNTELYKKIETKSLFLPQPAPLNAGLKEIPYFFIGDEAFALSESMMKVFPGLHPRGSKQRIFNYRICRARRVVENVFGILSSVFRVLRKPMLLEPEKAQLIVMAIACLHNFLRKQPDSRNKYTPAGTFDCERDGKLIEGSWRTQSAEEMQSFLPMRKIARKPPLKAVEIREELAAYVMNEGKIKWQDMYA